jgi:hypothetical protein
VSSENVIECERQKPPQALSNFWGYEYRKYKTTFHASPPAGASQHLTSAHPAPLGSLPPSQQLASSVGSQEAAGEKTDANAVRRETL